MEPTKLAVVVGATGTQGGSVISAFQKDPSFKIRAITRNVSSHKAQSLAADGIEVVTADYGNVSSLIAAFKDATVIFAVTNFWETFATRGPQAGMEADFTYGKNLADATAAIPTVSHYVWSIIPSASVLTTGKISVPHFEGKSRVDEYILRSLPKLAAKTTFLWVAYSGLNNLQLPMLIPRKIATSGKYALFQPCALDTPITTIGLPSKDIGLFVEAILRKPHVTLPARYVFAETDTLTVAELAVLLSDISKKSIECITVATADFDKLWPVWGSEVAKQMTAWESAGDKSWTKEGVKVVSKEDLGVEGLVVLREALSEADWGLVE